MKWSKYSSLKTANKVAFEKVAEVKDADDKVVKEAYIVLVQKQFDSETGESLDDSKREWSLSVASLPLLCVAITTLIVSAPSKQALCACAISSAVLVIVYPSNVATLVSNASILAIASCNAFTAFM